jgi:hypothetical protein
VKTAIRMIEVAAEQPKEALTDVLGLAALCAIMFIGFAATSLA